MEKEKKLSFDDPIKMLMRPRSRSIVLSLRKAIDQDF